MLMRWATFLVWAVVMASAVAWGLQLFVTAPEAPAQTAVASAALGARGDVTRVLGADAVAASAEAEVAADARFQLLGVVAPRAAHAAREGVALIAVDGKAPKAFRVGAVVDGSTVLQAVRARGADLGPAGGKPTLALNIPPPAPAATGTLPPAGAAVVRAPGAPAAPPPMPAAPPAAVPVLPSMPVVPIAPPGGPRPGAMAAPAPIPMQAAPVQQLPTLPQAPPRSTQANTR